MIWKVLTNIGLLVKLGKKLPQVVEYVFSEKKLPACEDSLELVLILREIFAREIFPLGIANRHMVETLDSFSNEVTCKRG